jgi:tritrans,polycis-undecaprenyl-diphosphate synthase [geranylgeranyl-diphosphate specific]
MIAMVYRSKPYSFVKEKIDEFQNLKRIEHIKKQPVPNHIAVIMDGNRRFAKDIGIEPDAGHYFGRDKIREILDWCVELGINNLTLYAFSTQNFNRTPEEVDRLMNLCRRELEKATTDSRIHKNKVRIKVIGNLESLPKDVQHKAKIIMEETNEYKNHTLSIALAYGGREEIVEAIHQIAEDVKKDKLKPEEIDEQKVSSYLYTNGIPDPDLILRTSGEERLSNFLLWQMAYSELYFSDVYWPAFQKKDFLHAVETYQQRKRRFGK